MVSKFVVRTGTQTSTVRPVTRGQNVHVFFVDEKGDEHPIENCKSLVFTVPSRQEPCTLALTIVGDLELEIATEVAAAAIKQDDS